MCRGRPTNRPIRWLEYGEDTEMYINVTVFLSSSFFSRESLSTFFDDDSDAASRISCHSKLSVGQTPTLFLRLFHMFFSVFCPFSVFCSYFFCLCLLSLSLRL